ncbi:hypothetical protein IEQ34_014093 [Dendrobium chrysotoxum]|uniref:DUF6817 domain-containing protein n=1 Tax=Dendrobium chrysotoxum TaxID=161865 RepID=A0AAV7GJ94_DENCH|nr:hypothetical protein IEQ34_014093 [Dendrobium chrysotoxum]
MHSSNTPFSSLLPLALPFLRAEPHLVDPNLPHMISAITSVGAGECWHKDNCFLGHLLDVYRILKLWGAPDPVARCGLFHSVYSNSYVDLAIFDPANGGRELLRSIAGDEAEKLVHLFCVVPRQSLIHDDLLFQYTEGELVEHLTESEESIRRARDEGVVDEREPWRRKMVEVLPAVIDAISIKFDHEFTFQDELFDNTDGQMNFSGNTFTALWPGDGRPGLWMNSLSRMAALYNLILREESLYLQSRKASSHSHPQQQYDIPQFERDEALELIVPPVFSNCTKVLGRESQLIARDLYWKAMTGPANKDMAAAESLLMECCKENGYVAEPHLVLGQVYMALERYEEAEREAEEGLRLLLEWGSPWDKRMSWEGWVAWGRLILQKAKARSWPKTSFGIISLGLVR